jgi:hypothetical protein
MNANQRAVYRAQLDRLLTLNDELDRLRAAVDGGTDVVANEARIAEIVAESGQIMDAAKLSVVPPAPLRLNANVPTSGQLSGDLSATPSERELLRVALFNSASAGVLYYAVAARIWNVDARRGREICTLLGVDPDSRKEVRRAGSRSF